MLNFTFDNFFVSFLQIRADTFPSNCPFYHFRSFNPTLFHTFRTKHHYDELLFILLIATSKAGTCSICDSCFTANESFNLTKKFICIFPSVPS